jgi:hypothetical protein
MNDFKKFFWKVCIACWWLISYFAMVIKNHCVARNQCWLKKCTVIGLIQHLQLSRGSSASLNDRKGEEQLWIIRKKLSEIPMSWHYVYIRVYFTLFDLWVIYTISCFCKSIAFIAQSYSQWLALRNFFPWFLRTQDRVLHRKKNNYKSRKTEWDDGVYFIMFTFHLLSSLNWSWFETKNWN